MSHALTVSDLPKRPRTPLARFQDQCIGHGSNGHGSNGHGNRAVANRSIAPRIPRILCIDDDPEICRSLEMRLRRYRATVALAYFGTHGFWEAITDRPDVILMDVNMPSGDGRFVLESLRNNPKTERTPVIILTGMREAEIRTEMLALGANRFLNKPIHFDVLLNELRLFIDLKEQS